MLHSEGAAEPNASSSTTIACLEGSAAHVSPLRNRLRVLRSRLVGAGPAEARDAGAQHTENVLIRGLYAQEATSCHGKAIRR